MSTAAPLPADIRLMNIAASVLFAAGIVLLLASLGWWALRHPVFRVAGITVEGDVTHNNVATLRANVAPHLSGNFFTLDLRTAREAFEAVPWVRRAVVRREFPDRLRVRLEEHRAAALWGADTDSRIVDTFGEVFEANVGEVESENLPRLEGPDSQAGEVLAMYRMLKPLFEPLDLAIDRLTLTARGSWEAELDNEGLVELGRGTSGEIAARTQRFVRTLNQVTSRYSRTPQALISADLRHTDGYALRLRGVGTTDAVKK